MKNKKQKHSAEHKDITCAVRIPRSLYESLTLAAKVVNSSLSDVIRDAIVEKIELIKMQEVEKRLKNEKIRAQLEELAKNGGSSSGGRIDDIMDLLEA
jgi:uncharacterized protein (DUF1778 family)